MEPEAEYSEQSTVPHGVLPAEQGRATLDEADEDIRTHGSELNKLLLQAYSTSQGHIIAVKKRLIEEKEIAMMEAERTYLNQYDKFQSEIRALQADIESREQHEAHESEKYWKLGESAATLAGNYVNKYSANASMNRTFQAWHEEVKNSRQCHKLDKVAKAFARKYLLAKTFLTMCLSSQRRKANKQNAEAKFKFDSVTTEIITSYEKQMEAMREDLKEAYMTIEAEQLRRQQLEEDLRRLFLKNMTTMNFEALSLFQNCHNMVESTPAAVHASQTMNSPPRPVRRDLSPSSTRSAKHRSNNGHPPHATSRSPGRHSSPPGVPGHGRGHHHREASPSAQSAVSQQQQAEHDEFLRQQALQYEQIEHLISGSHSLQTPSIRTPPVQALRPRYVAPAYSADNHPLVVGKGTHHESHVEEVFARASLSGSVGGGSSYALHTNQLSDMYRASMSTTNRLAHNASPPQGHHGHGHGHHSSVHFSSHHHSPGSHHGSDRHSPLSRNSPESVPSMPSTVSSTPVPVPAPERERVKVASHKTGTPASHRKPVGKSTF